MSRRFHLDGKGNAFAYELAVGDVVRLRDDSQHVLCMSHPTTGALCGLLGRWTVNGDSLTDIADIVAIARRAV